MSAAPGIAKAPGTSGWSPAQALVLTVVVLLGSVFLRSLILLRGQSTSDSLVAVGALAAGADSDRGVPPLEWMLSSWASGLAPMEYWPLGVSLVALWICYCGAAWLAVRAVAKSASTRLALLVFLVFSPMTVPGLSVWPAGVLSAAIAIGIMLTTYGAARVTDWPRIRSLVALAGGTAIALLGADGDLVSPAMIVPAWAIALLAISARQARGLPPIRPFAWAWAAGAVLLPVAAYAVGAVAGGNLRGVTIPRDLGAIAAYVGESLGAGALPALAGGPLTWSMGIAASPVATPPAVVTFIGVQVLLAGVASTVILTGRGLMPWAVALGFVAALLILIPLSLPATATGTGAQMLGLAAAPALLLLGAAAATAQEVPGRSIRDLSPRTRALVAFVAVDAFIATSMVSALAWSEARATYPGRDYVASALASLAEAPRDTTLLPQVVPSEVANFAYAPLNRTDIIFAPAVNRPRFAPWTTRLMGLDDEGTLRPAVVDGISVPVTCEAWAPDLTVGQSLPDFTYVMAIGRPEGDLAGFSVRLGDGPSTVVPAGLQAQTVYVMVSGAGNAITIAPLGAEPVCPTALRIGQIRVLSPQGGDPGA